MSVFQFIQNGVQQSMSQVSQARGMGQNVMSTIQQYPNKVSSAWIGGDADAFSEKVLTKLIPAIAELIAAIAGINLNLTDAMSAVESGDQKVSKLAGGLKDVFQGI